MSRGRPFRPTDRLWSMAGAAIVLLAGAGGTVLALLAIGLAIYGLRTRRPRRATIAGGFALAGALVGILLTAPIWRVVLSGRDTHQEPLDYAAMAPFMVMMGIQAIAAALGLVCLLRRRARHPDGAPR